MTYQETIAQLRKTRLEKGLVQSVVAEKLGVSQGMFSRYEKGADVPSTTLIRWGELLGLKVSLTETQVAA